METTTENESIGEAWGTDSSVADSATGQDAILHDIAKMGCDESIPIHERINALYVKSMDLAIGAVAAAIEAGNLLLRQRHSHERKDGNWTDWLAKHCTNISQRTAYNLMKAAEYAKEHGGVEATTIRQLYLEAGALKEHPAGAGEPGPGRTIISPFIDAWKKARLGFTDKKLEALNPIAAPQLLGWIRQVKEEAMKMEERLVAKFPDAAKTL